MEIALAMERLNLQYLYNLHEVADKHGDGQFADFVETMLEEQVCCPAHCTNIAAGLSCPLAPFSPSLWRYCWWQTLLIGQFNLRAALLASCRSCC